MTLPPAPLFRDPIYDGAADPTIIWNPIEKSWWLLYTNRRANVSCQQFAWVHGTDIGIASSTDHGQSWLYRGVLQGLEFERGHNTFWAPEILFHDGLYHMYVSYVPGVPIHWTGTRHIVHMTSKNLWDWKFESKLHLSSDRVIDACIFQIPDGIWRMWYKDEVNHSHTFLAESKDLYSWEVKGPVITDCPHEGPNVFFWKGYYWMITDPWQGLGVYRSDDASKWKRQANILNQGGNRPDDYTMALHADVLVQDERAFVFYFTHPDRTHKAEPPDSHPLSYKRSSLQVAELEFRDGSLSCNRDKPFDFYLQ
jgi:hypothetical protein